MSRLRKQIRREAKEAERTSLTVSDAWAINELRRLPIDQPSRGLRKRKGRPQRPRLVFPNTTTAAEAWRYLKLIYRCPEALSVCRWMRDHPGPQSQLPPEALLLGIFLATERTGRYLRGDVCSIINGLDATILHHLGLCDNKTFKPVSYSTVGKQILRFEQDVPFTELMHKAIPNPPDSSLFSWMDDSDGAHPGFLWLNLGMNLAAVPKRRLKKIRTGAVDGTAFPTAARPRRFDKQKDVDKAVREAIEAGGPLPAWVIVGPDGKLIRCPYDIQARGGMRTGSAETNYKEQHFCGYFVIPIVASRNWYWSGDPTRIRLYDDIAPYVLGFAVVPASRDKGPIARDATLALKQRLPGFNTQVADREFTERRSFDGLLHENDINVIADYPQPYVEKLDQVVLPNGQAVYRLCGDYFPLWTPKRFLAPFDENTIEAKISPKEARRRFYEDRARYRYTPNGSIKDGKVQLMCPQCSGRVIYAEKTRMGKHRNGKFPTSALDLGTHAAGHCCIGSVTLSGEELHRWQPIPWGTTAQANLYDWGRSRIENTNGISRKDGGISKKSCRAPGTAAHNMAYLAISVVNNVQWAGADPLADPEPDDMPKAALSLACVLPAEAGGTVAKPAVGHTQNGQEAATPPRAPP